MLKRKDWSYFVGLLGLASATGAVLAEFDNLLPAGGRLPHKLLVGVLALLVWAGWAIASTLFKSKAEDRLEIARNDLEKLQAEAGTSGGDKKIQEKAIDVHAEQLNVAIEDQRKRALGAFIPGVGMCVFALAGPFAAYRLAAIHEHWEYMLGGSTLAAVLLGAGTALLRHDNKMQEQIQKSQGEFLYFSRLKTGLQCASTLSEEEYRKGLTIVTTHLLAPPPSLSMTEPLAKEDDSDEKFSLKDFAEQIASLVAEKTKK